MEPDVLEAYWHRSEAVLHDIEVPTQQQGRNIDWFVCSSRAPVSQVDTVVVEGTDHVGVRLTLSVVHGDTLGKRIETPTAIEAAMLIGATEEDCQVRHRHEQGVPGDL